MRKGSMLHNILVVLCNITTIKVVDVYTLSSAFRWLLFNAATIFIMYYFITTNVSQFDSIFILTAIFSYGMKIVSWVYLCAVILSKLLLFDYWLQSKRFK